MKARLTILLLALLLMVPAFGAGSVYDNESNDLREILQGVCDELNKELPQEVDEDLYMLCILIEDNDLVLYFLMTDDTDFAEWTDEELEEYNKYIEDDLVGDEEFETFRTLCKEAGLGLVLKVEDNNENVLSTRIDVND